MALIVALVILVFFGVGYAVRAAVPVDGARPALAATTARAMLVSRVFGIDNDGLNLGRQPAVLLPRRHLARAGLLDVRGRPAADRRPDAVGCATAASLFPFVGTIVYMIVRPPEYLEDVRERELEMQAAEARLRQLGYHALPALRLRGRARLPALPDCLRKLKDPCANCGKPLDPQWTICPYCEAEVAGRTPPRRAAARRRPAEREARAEAPRSSRTSRSVARP